MREDEERRLAEEAERNAQDLAESEERRRKREEFCQALNFEAAQLKFSRELTRAFTYSYMHSPTPIRIHPLPHAFTYSYMQLMHSLGLKASAAKPHESESRLYQT